MRILVVLLITLLAAPVTAAEQPCQDTLIVAQADTRSETQRLCTDAAAALEILDSYNIPHPGQLTVTAVDSFDIDCVGVYHCGERKIEILSAAALARVRSDESIFAELSLHDYLASILLHEILHAAFDQVPCPRDSCTVTSEYLAYGIQISALSPAQRATVTAHAASKAATTRDEINLWMLMLAPDNFGLKAWSHLSQRPDPMGYVALIMSGAIVFDSFHP